MWAASIGPRMRRTKECRSEFIPTVNPRNALLVGMNSDLHAVRALLRHRGIVCDLRHHLTCHGLRLYVDERELERTGHRAALDLSPDRIQHQAAEHDGEAEKIGGRTELLHRP